MTAPLPAHLERFDPRDWLPLVPAEPGWWRPADMGPWPGFKARRLWHQARADWLAAHRPQPRPTSSDLDPYEVNHTNKEQPR